VRKNEGRRREEVGEKRGKEEGEERRERSKILTILHN
jgi:hypothetical protein